ncbi:hypothetical protein TWF481_010331 [Arthrobotrys musiformis]|uniref:LysM domain-containing protein n=1 Tax=Arthrobotrys musiformis TaxID=47236 RepID=A0AAV9W3B4_9PEZI
MYRYLIALVSLELLNSCHAYVPQSPKFLRERQNSPLSAAATAIAGCSKWFTPIEGDSCVVVAALNTISVDDFIKWNPSLASGDCDKLIRPGTSYCVYVPPPPPPPPKTTTPAPNPNPTTKESPKPTVPGNGVSTPSPIQSGMIANCNKFHLVASGQSCQDIVSKYKLSIDILFKWNRAIGAQCTNMWADNYLCVGIIGGTPTPTTTKAPPADGTPSPIGANTTKNCKKWAFIRSGDTCQAILDRNRDVKSTLKDLVRWNPSVKADCSGLIAHYFLCIVGPAAPPSTTKPAPANPTPSPIQPGQTKNCKGWTLVKQGETCQHILKRHPKVTMAQLFAWNPAIGKDCSKMWAKTYLCVAA